MIPSPDPLARRAFGGTEAEGLRIRRQKKAFREMRQGVSPYGDKGLADKDGDKPDGWVMEDKEKEIASQEKKRWALV